MHEAPTHVTDDQVLAAVRDLWDADVDDLVHLPVGFGAHHWRASAAGQPRWFVTLDALGERHDADSLEAAYASARDLADQDLAFVVAPVLSRDGRCTAPLAGGALSLTPWHDGRVAGDGPFTGITQAQDGLRMLNALHAATPPPDLHRWEPRTSSALALLDQEWDGGPFGQRAREAVRAHAVDLERWSASYARLAAQAERRPWVTTHGEPHTRNQLATPDGLLLVDWESVALAPRERDLGTHVQSGFAHLLPDIDGDMAELFDLDWRLEEVADYAAWFAGPHGDTESDAVAFDGLLEELERPG